MIFTDCPIDDLKAGFILAHSLKTDGRNFKKGHILSDEDIEILSARISTPVTVAILEKNDVHEDKAATILSTAMEDDNFEVTASFTGRVNILAKREGIFTYAAEHIIHANLVNEGITIATIPDYTWVQARQLLATIKIIPFSVAQNKVKLVLEYLKQSNLALHPFKLEKITLIQTELPSIKQSVLDKTTKTLSGRLTQLSSTIIKEDRVTHTVAAVRNSLENIPADTQLIIIAGASAITDRRDTIPAALEEAGGKTHYYGMPVDPGNLLLVGSYKNIPVIGMPGCARSPKLNGFDWVLQRVSANIPITKRTLAEMSVGGLLKEIPDRPAPRLADKPPIFSDKSHKFGIILLAAGQSRRMGDENKLLSTYQGRPLLNHALDCITKTKVNHHIIVVTGQASDQITRLLSSYDVNIIHNPDYKTGIASSLKMGISHLPEDCDAALICLSDMPLLSPKDLQQIFASFSKHHNHEICIPTFTGKRGNPVLIGKRFFPEIMELSGDIGAKPIISAYPDCICEVAMKSDAVLIDADTPEELARLNTR